MKSNSFLHWSCFISLALLIITSVALGANILVQWAILVIALSSLSPSFSLDPLMQNTMKGDADEDIEQSSIQNDEEFTHHHHDTFNPTFEANLLPPATTVGFYDNGKVTATRKRTNKRRR